MINTILIFAKVGIFIEIAMFLVFGLVSIAIRTAIST